MGMTSSASFTNHRLATRLADCYIDCDMVIHGDYIILSCGPVWCDGEGG